MKCNPLVSIIIPSYNKGKWLTEAIFSAFGQTYSQIEVVVNDDGSTDQSDLLIKSFTGYPGFVSIRSDECSGKCSVSKNRAIDASHGEYLAFLDADDILRPYHVSDLMDEALSDPKIGFLFGNVTLIDEEKNVIAGPWAPVEDAIFNRCSVGLVTSIIKRSVFDELGRFDESLGFSEDWDLIIRVFRALVPRKYVNVSNYLGRRLLTDASVAKDAGTRNPNFKSQLRIENHSRLREKHNLPGPCGCGCGAMAPERFTITSQMVSGEDAKISASMIVRNEESVLGPCLESIKGIDEIVILDTGSTDKTPDVVRDHPGKIEYIFGEYVWADNFAEARNESLKRCTGDWILIIDADEHLEEGGIQKIRDFLKTVPVTVNGVGFKTVSDGAAIMHESVRLFRNKVGVIWHGAIHNYLSVRAEVSADITLYYGYSPAHSRDPDRALRILTKEIEKTPTALRERFYLAREYYYRKDWQVAIDHYRLYLEKAHWAPEKAEAWVQVARCYANLNMNFEARLACLRAIDVNADFKDAIIVMASLSEEPNAGKWRCYAELAKNSNTLFCSTR